MNILFVMKYRGNSGNTHAVANYIRVGQKHGHSVALYGTPQPHLPDVRFSTDVRTFDRVIFSFESELYRVKRLQEVALLAAIPCRRRFVLDSDGLFNPMLELDGYDRNYLGEAQRAAWLRHFEALSDSILQPTLRPTTDPRVKPLPFYGYDPELTVGPATAPAKRYDVLHVGHNWWRWREVAGEVLPGLEQIRGQLGEIGFIGLWWDRAPDEARELGLDVAYQVDAERLRRLRIDTASAVPFGEVIRIMSTARVNIFTQRPVLKHLRHLTLKYFEVFCADTVPLLMLGDDLAEAVYGPAGRELTLPGRVAEKVVDALRRPDHYRQVVADVRRHLVAHHSYDRRVGELVAALHD